MAEASALSRRIGARWPTVLGILLAAGAIGAIALLDVDVQFAVGVPNMAGIYLVAYALGRPAAAWPAFPALGAVTAVTVLLGLHPAVAMTAFLVVLWGWAVAQGRGRDGLWFGIETAGMICFGALTLLAVMVDPALGGVVAGVAWLAHGAWDAYHYVAEKVVNRPWAEMCAVVDIPVGIALITAALVR